MNKQDAFKILGLYGEVTPIIIKDTYRKACMKYHPDRNPSGTEMMQLVNAAYQEVRDFTGDTEVSDVSDKYCENLSNALNNIIKFGLNIEVCGAWVWVDGNTKPHKDTLKNNGFKWASKKLRWYYRPEDYKSSGRGTWSMSKIRERYGSDTVDNKQDLLAA